MTDTVAEALTLEQLARDNAEWIGRRLAAGDVESLQFLKFRPLREVEDVLAAARQLQADRQAEWDAEQRRVAGTTELPDEAVRIPATLAANVVTALLDAQQLAKGHTGGHSRPTLGYHALEYPVTTEETARVLAAAADATRLLRLPGADRGWTWSQAVDVDAETLEVTVRLRASHASLTRP